MCRGQQGGDRPKTKLIFMNFPSNPTGGVASRAQLEALADVIQKRAPSEEDWGI